jgi:predicted nucleic acid-binding protein
MNAVFVDTGGWMACADRGDPAHVACTAARDATLEAGRTLITTDFVVDEMCARSVAERRAVADLRHACRLEWRARVFAHGYVPVNQPLRLPTSSFRMARRCRSS